MPAVPPLLVCLGRGRLKLLPLLLDCAEKKEKKFKIFLILVHFFHSFHLCENGCYVFIQIFENYGMI